MRHRRSAKILATLGPSSSTADRIKTLYEAGADAFRFNFSHGTHDDHRDRYEIVRSIESDVGRPISIVMDLQGPKLRVGTFENDRIDLKAGQTFRFDLDDKPGDETRVRLPHVEIFRAIEERHGPSP